ncbi:MAG: hypothetical protein K6A23_13600 [Butyrivibrio sp.]|nr:hypothetical protein [Butyrivibrio sp.]
MDEERDLLKSIQNGDKKSLATLWEMKKKLCFKAIRKFFGLTDQEDLKQECFIYFYSACMGFDIHADTQFNTYLWKTVQMGAQRYILNATHVIRVPEWLNDTAIAYKKLCNEYLKDKGTLPPDPDAIKILKISKSNLENIKIALNVDRVESLDKPFSDDDTGTLTDILTNGDDFAAKIDDIEEFNNLSKTLWDLVDSIDESEIIRKKFIDNMTFKDINNALNIKNSYSGYLRGLKFLKRHKHKLKPYYTPKYEKAYHNVSLNSFNRTGESIVEKIALENLTKSMKNDKLKQILLESI